MPDNANELLGKPIVSPNSTLDGLGLSSVESFSQTPSRNSSCRISFATRLSNKESELTPRLGERSLASPTPSPGATILSIPEPELLESVVPVPRLDPAADSVPLSPDGLSETLVSTLREMVDTLRVVGSIEPYCSPAPTADCDDHFPVDNESAQNAALKWYAGRLPRSDSYTFGDCQLVETHPPKVHGSNPLPCSESYTFEVKNARVANVAGKSHNVPALQNLSIMHGIRAERSELSIISESCQLSDRPTLAGGSPRSILPLLSPTRTTQSTATGITCVRRPLRLPMAELPSSCAARGLRPKSVSPANSSISDLPGLKRPSPK